jgi:LmbE family N-acetylglucosaminyl deacetylase
MPQNLRLLAVLAHPDDESLGLGGMLARYAGEGVETHLLTATRGERGRFRGVREGEGSSHPGADALAEIRTRELEAAARVLGLRSVEILGYGDGRLDQMDPNEVTGRIVQHLRTVRPQVVVTFGPDGAYGHPDHIAISQFTTAACVAAATDGRGGTGGEGAPHAVDKLYYIAWNESAWGAYQEAFKTLISLVDGVERRARPWPDWEITTVLDTRAQWETAWRAVRCHESQVASYERLGRLPPSHHEALWGWQGFYRVYSTVNGGREREDDLFAGLRPRRG